MCPVVDAEPGKSGSESGPLSHGHAREDYPSSILEGMMDLKAALIRAAAAMEAMAESNQMLVQAMAEDVGSGDYQPSTYMNGSAVR